ncbi:pilus assembly protein [Agaricicola taiwanensis]|uniref:Pilus assembly protein n=1 Tax=Agaricicola taiwanensis TaxID=591372 RepID=A0A8J2YBH0_9RHOB|nr:AAA family ATPase [Agaricicola taiwanensis]GGE33206.1 pilus assembly protein [Agaricicola taiwanensis]
MSQIGHGDDDNNQAAEHNVIAPLPRVSIQAFCETPAIAQLMQSAALDRRMSKAHVKVQMGGIPAAVEAYRSAPTPNVIVLESDAKREVVLEGLDKLSAFCDAGTKVVIIGKLNDVVLYRELMRRGVSEYLVGPITELELIATLSEIFRAPDSEPVGRTIAFVGAKGGSGASTVAHNVSWAIARDMALDSVIVDLDLAFGTAGLDFNQDPPQGVAEAVFTADRLDSNVVDRLLAKCTEHLSLLAAPSTLDRPYDFREDAFDPLLDILRANIPCIVLDVPHVWSSWAKRSLVIADEIVVVAEPDLANLRNAKNIFDKLKAERPNDAQPRLVLNKIGLTKRPEIKPSDFAKALDTDPIGTIGFDAQVFGTASNNGQMIAETSASHKANEGFLDIARVVTGRAEVRVQKRGIMSLAPILTKLSKKSA